jgi:hypothetical protein
MSTLQNGRPGEVLTEIIPRRDIERVEVPLPDGLRSPTAAELEALEPGDVVTLLARVVITEWNTARVEAISADVLVLCIRDFPSVGGEPIHIAVAREGVAAINPNDH